MNIVPELDQYLNLIKNVEEEYQLQVLKYVPGSFISAIPKKRLIILNLVELLKVGFNIIEFKACLYHEVGHVHYNHCKYKHSPHFAEYSADAFAVNNGCCPKALISSLKKVDLIFQRSFKESSITHPSTEDRAFNLGVYHEMF